MSGIRRELMDLNGDSGAAEELYSLQGETIPLVLPGTSGIGMDDAVFLQAQQESAYNELCRR